MGGNKKVKLESATSNVKFHGDVADRGWFINGHRTYIHSEDRDSFNFDFKFLSYVLLENRFGQLVRYFASHLTVRTVRAPSPGFLFLREQASFLND